MYRIFLEYQVEWYTADSDVGPFAGSSKPQYLAPTGSRNFGYGTVLYNAAQYWYNWNVSGGALDLALCAYGTVRGLNPTWDYNTYMNIVWKLTWWYHP